MNAQILFVISVAVLQSGLTFAGYYHPSYDRYVKYGIDYWWKREREFLKQWERPPPKPLNCPTPPMPYPQPGPTPPGPQALPGAGSQQPPAGAGAIAGVGAAPQYPQYPGNNQSPSSAQMYKPPAKTVASRPAVNYPKRNNSKSKPYRG